MNAVDRTGLAELKAMMRAGDEAAREWRVMITEKIDRVEEAAKVTAGKVDATARKVDTIENRAKGGLSVLLFLGAVAGFFGWQQISIWLHMSGK